MSLEGNLTSFGLSEILQLIAVQQKSGMLSITRESGSMKLFFRDGRIVSTRDRRRGGVDPLKDYLARYGIISREELSRLTGVSLQSKLDITDVIVSEGVLAEEELRAHCRNHIQETVHDVLTWEQCSYKFVAGANITSDMKILAEAAVEGLLMESMRRIDEFPLILEEIPDGRATVKRTSGASVTGELTPNETTILELLDHERTVDDLVAHAKMPRFDTYETLRLLKEKGAVEVDRRAPAEAAGEPAASRARGSRFARRPNVAPFALSVLIFAACALWGARDFVPALHSRVESSSARNTAVKDPSMDRNRTEDELRWYLEIYRAQTGGYPDDLSALEASGIAPASVSRRAEEFSFRYHLTPGRERYILL